MPNLNINRSLDDFLRASIHLHMVNKPLALQSPFGRYSMFHAYSARGHACPYVIMQLRYHSELWRKEWREIFLAANIPSFIIEIGDYFADIENSD